MGGGVGLMPVSFTDHQLSVILAAAKLVPERWRVRFLETIADAFVDREPTDEAVQSAIADACARMHVSIEGCDPC